ncbi:hypothetical protein HanRHA438_Chr09g0383631 [Helianthus annuus]|nr:hypothetical protein HanHA300_Chr09g0305411 [Helianthus annuus]KAJ0541227.1 hypothetical protein HanHA89_Chr09g0326001 [Helianthus annuus]KAJ0706308.1 hypothetical protein HanLR1_Chr09g0305491 [Helianthus annuus]KAJ0886809.1 hypothetical protein HanRHA438_Chr09g0383631 [Helianthus annuus]
MPSRPYLHSSRHLHSSRPLFAFRPLLFLLCPSRWDVPTRERATHPRHLPGRRLCRFDNERWSLPHYNFRTRKF